jgi:transcriptional regulator with XRE-family HTH domain
MATSANEGLTTAMTVATRNDFGAVLRGWRTRRRLSQLDLAVAAGTTQRHLSFLEQGRSVPGRDVVTRIGTALQLSLRQSNALLAAAGFAPAHPETATNAELLEPVRTALQHVLDGHSPYPAMVMDGVGDLVAANDAFALLTEGVAPWLLEPPVNVLRVALHPDGIASRTVNLDDWRRHIFSGLHQRGPDARLDALIEELTGYGLPVPGGEPMESLGFAIPLHLRSSAGDVRFVATISTFVTALDVTVSELRLEAFLPADQQTAELLLARQAT